MVNRVPWEKSSYFPPLDIDFCSKIDINFEVLRNGSDLWLSDVAPEFKHTYTEHNQDNAMTDDMDSALFLCTEEDEYPEIDGSFHFDLTGY